MARFQIATPILFAPPNPEKVHDYRAPDSQIPSFGSFFAAYFGGHSYNLASQKASQMLEGMKKCYERNQKSDPVEKCAYYIHGFQRHAIAN